MKYTRIKKYEINKSNFNLHNRTAYDPQSITHRIDLPEMMLAMNK